jgi:hypothetical protein
MVHDIDLRPYINLKFLDEISFKNVFFFCIDLILNA